MATALLLANTRDPEVWSAISAGAWDSEEVGKAYEWAARSARMEERLRDGVQGNR